MKLSSGLAVFVTGIGLDLIHLHGNNSKTGEIVTGLRLLMTILPMIGLVAALLVFIKKFMLTDERIEHNAQELKKKKEGQGSRLN